mgnify:CR=1 FL=1
MKRYVVRRLLMAVPLLLAISFVCFMFINLIPSNPAEVALRIQQMPVITDEAVARMEEMLGLNKPFMVRYFDWAWQAAFGGISASRYVKSGPHCGWGAAALSPCHIAAGSSFFCDRVSVKHPHWFSMRCV